MLKIYCPKLGVSGFWVELKIYCPELVNYIHFQVELCQLLCFKYIYVKNILPLNLALAISGLSLAGKILNSFFIDKMSMEIC